MEAIEDSSMKSIDKLSVINVLKKVHRILPDGHDFPCLLEIRHSTDLDGMN